MATYLLAVLALGLLCAGWVALELWLGRIDPQGRDRPARCGHCGGCAPDRREAQEGADQCPEPGQAPRPGALH